MNDEVIDFFNHVGYISDWSDQLLKIDFKRRFGNKPMRLPEKVAHALEKAILRGEYPAGSRFPPERELAERFKVSRSTIREAVGKLAQLGLVETHPQSGTYVSDYLTEGSLDLLVHLMKHSETVDEDVVLSLMEFREMSELTAVRKAVRIATDLDIEALREIVRQESRPSIGYKEIAECDYELHATILRLSNNLILQLLFNSFKPVYRFYANFFFRLPEAISATVSQHRRLIRAFSERDEESAVSIMAEALRYGEQRVADALGIRNREKGTALNRTHERAASSGS